MGMIGNSLAQGLISGANIQDGTVDTPDLKDAAVTPAKLSTGKPTWDSTGNVTAGTGILTPGVFNGTYTDGLVSDYSTGWGRFTVGASDGFYWRNAGISSPTTLMALDSNGRLGIGQTTPAYKLDILGTEDDTTNFIFNAINAVATNNRGAVPDKVAIRLGVTSDSGVRASKIVAFEDGNNTYNVGLAFYTNNTNADDSPTERVRIDSSGKVSIASGPASVATLQSQLQISPPPLGAAPDSYANFVSFRVSNSSTPDKAWTWKGSPNKGLTLSYYSEADTFATEYQRVTLDNSGNVGIGVTSPVGKLCVAQPSATTFGDTATSGINLIGSGEAVGNLAQIGFGAFRSTSIVYSPAAIGFVTKSTSGFNYGDLIFATRSVTTDTAPTERMRIDNSGNVGIGTNNPQTRLHLSVPSASGATCTLRLDNPYYNNWDITNNTNLLFARGGTTRALIVSNGQWQTTADAANDVAAQWYNSSSTNPYGIYVALSGASPNNTSNYVIRAVDSTTSCYTIWSNGTTSGRSDERLKKNIVDATTKLSDVCSLRIRNYEWIDSVGGHKEIGLIAQEVEEVFPGLVVTHDPEKDGDDFKEVKYSAFIPILLKAVQELKAEFDAYKEAHP